MEILPGIWGLSPLAALVGLLVTQSWLVTSGRMIPKSSHERELSSERTRADEWKAVAGERKHTIDSLVIQNTAMLEATKTTAAVVQALPVPKSGG